MVLSKCTICDSKKSIFIKNQEAKRLFSNLGIKTPLSKIPRLGNKYQDKFFDKKSKCNGVNILLELNEQLAKELHKPIIRKF